MASEMESMAICAIRYCIGRQSYIVGSGIEWAREWGAKSAHVRDVIRHDLRDLVGKCERRDTSTEGGSGVPWLGAKHDEKEWRAVLADLDAMEATNADPR